MYYQNPPMKENLRERIETDAQQYYAVFVMQDGFYKRHVLKARTDLDAALKVKKLTGVMPSSDRDVIGPLPSSSHGYDKMTRELWLGK